MPDTKLIDEFPEYEITKDGTVYTASNGLRRRSSTTRTGAAKITLYRDGQPFTKSLALLVAKAYLYNDHDPEIFDTPIHLDNDLRNNHVENLMWRPRWFAVAYQKQYWKEEFRNATTGLEDETTGDTYVGFMQPCQRYGLLYKDIIQSCTRGDTVFPTWKIFRFRE